MKSKFLLLCIIIAFTCSSCKDKEEFPSYDCWSEQFIYVPSSFLNNIIVDPGDTNYVNLNRAFIRYCDYKIGKRNKNTINISNNLYQFFERIGNHKIILTRNGIGSISVSPNDCVACTIGELWRQIKQGDYKLAQYIHDIAWNKIQTLYGDGVPYNNPPNELITIMHSYFGNVQNYNGLPFDYSFINEPNLGAIAIVADSTNQYHSLSILQATGSLVLCRDDQNGGTKILNRAEIICSFLVSNPIIR